MAGLLKGMPDLQPELIQPRHFSHHLTPVKLATARRRACSSTSDRHTRFRSVVLSCVLERSFDKVSCRKRKKKPSFSSNMSVSLSLTCYYTVDGYRASGVSQSLDHATEDRPSRFVALTGQRPRTLSSGSSTPSSSTFCVCVHSHTASLPQQQQQLTGRAEHISM